MLSVAGVKSLTSISQKDLISSRHVNLGCRWTKLSALLRENKLIMTSPTFQKRLNWLANWTKEEATRHAFKKNIYNRYCELAVSYAYVYNVQSRGSHRVENAARPDPTRSSKVFIRTQPEPEVKHKPLIRPNPTFFRKLEPDPTRPEFCSLHAIHLLMLQQAQNFTLCIK